MKKILLCLGFCACLLCASFASLQAQEAPSSKGLMKTFAARLRQAPAIEAQFTAEGLQGRLVLQGQAFRLETEAYEVYCDGHNRWTYNKEVEEVMLVPHDSLSLDLLENPLAFLLAENKAYKLPARPTSVHYQGTECWKITLTPATSAATYEFVTVQWDKARLTPRSVVCGLQDGTHYEIELHGFRDVEARDAAYFAFSAQAHPQAYIVDLR